SQECRRPLSLGLETGQSGQYSHQHQFAEHDQCLGPDRQGPGNRQSGYPGQSAVQRHHQPGYVAGQMTSGAVAPDFQRTINVYDSQGGSQPITFSFVKTGANTWGYEATYSG